MYIFIATILHVQYLLFPVRFGKFLRYSTENFLLSYCALRNNWICKTNGSIGQSQFGQRRRISLFLPYERNTVQVRMPAPVGSGGLG